MSEALGLFTADSTPSNSPLVKGENQTGDFVMAKKKKKRRRKSAWREALGDLRGINWGLAILALLAGVALFSMGHTAILLLAPAFGIGCLVLSAKGIVPDAMGCGLTILGGMILFICLVFGICYWSAGGMRLH